MTRWDKRADMVVHEAEPFNAESNSVVLAESYLTEVDRFYSRNHGPIPDISAQGWTLTVDGDGVTGKYTVGAGVKVHLKDDGKGKAATINQVKVGDHVAVIGAGTGPLTAKRVLDMGADTTK